MPRVPGGPTTGRRHRKMIKRAKGYFGARSRLYRTAKESVHRALQSAYRDRRRRKRDFRRLWITRINAGAHAHGLSYGRLVHGLKLAGVELDRKVLADMAVNNPVAFTAVCKKAGATLAGR